MSGADEARARAALLEMQLRLAQGPQAALGIESTAPERVRAAFLELTKQFHPARFGRMSPELQKLSNEVFLGIKSAHDTLMGSARPPRGGRQTGMPPIRAEASERTKAAVNPPPAPKQSGAVPALPRPPSPQPAPGTQPPRAAQPPRVSAQGSASLPAQKTPPHGVPVQPPPPPPNPDTQRGVTAKPGRITSGQAPVTRGAPPKFDEDGALQAALGLLSSKQWSAARQALHALAARVPQSKHYRALLCYTRGREAHAAGRLDEALQEYQRALQLVPDLPEAKQALVDLRRR